MSKLALILVLVSLILMGCAGSLSIPTAQPVPTATPPGTAKKSGTIRYGDLTNIDVRDVPTLIALDDLKAQGYTVEISYLAESPLLVDGLSRGDLDIAALNNQTMWTGISKGVDARTIAESIGPTAVVVAKQELKTCADLDGKNLGVPTATTLTTKLVNLYMQQNCPNAKPQIVVVGANDARNAGLENGQLDAALVQSEALLKLERDMPGKFHTLISLPQEFPQVKIDGFQARSKWAQENPEIVKDFLRALLKANRQVNENPELAVQEAVKRVKLDAPTAKQIYESYKALDVWNANGGITKEEIQSTIDFLTKQNNLPTGLTVDRVSDLSYLNAVLDEMGRK